MSLNITQYKKGCVHFIGCGGAGMFPLALILIVKGMLAMFFVFAVVTMGLSFKYYQLKEK